MIFWKVYGWVHVYVGHKLEAALYFIHFWFPLTLILLLFKKIFFFNLKKFLKVFSGKKETSITVGRDLLCLAPDPSTWLGPDSSCISGAWCPPIPLMALCSVELLWLWDPSYPHQPPSLPTPWASWTELSPPVPPIYLTTCLCPSNQGIICEIFFPPHFLRGQASSLTWWTS